MSSLPKYAREYYDDFLMFIINRCKKKKKEFLKVMNNKSYTEFLRYIDVCILCQRNWKPVYEPVEVLEESLAFLYYFNKSRHFCVQKLPTMEYNNVELFKYLDDKDYIIDFKHNNSNFFIHAYKRNIPIVSEETSAYFEYTVDVYGDLSNVREYNRQHLTKQSLAIIDYLLIYRIHISVDRNINIVEFHDCNEFIMNIFNHALYDLSIDGKIIPAVLEVSGKSGTNYSEAGLPTNKEVLNLIQHVIDCYENRATLTRKNGKVAKRYNESKVHIAATEDNDVYKPLHMYVKEYEPSIRGEYKGGHHVSPIPHERCGHFRRSRGKGDYDLVDGKFIKVEKGKGKYSFVKATSVNANKDTDKVLVYKI